MLRPFDNTDPLCALKIYLILIGMAVRRATVTYGELDDKIGRGGARLLAGPLRCLMRWCHQEGLPALTAIVVEKDNGRPSSGLTTVEGDFAAEQQRVFRHDWFAHFPPTIEELAEK